MSRFYIAGGMLPADAPSYVERRADHDLLDALRRGEFCYVLTSRQMGKSSLMNRTAARLKNDGDAVAILDLTAVGQNLSAEQWYDGLLNLASHQLGLEDELDDFWLGSRRLGPLHRWMEALRAVVLPHCRGRVVLFVDEVDVVRSLPFSTDEFFAGIRECYNRRAQDPALGRLCFCLLGVATPGDLVRDVRTTPFNIGRRIVLDDFTEGEAAALAAGLGGSGGDALLRRVLHWTNGHPYLTQRLCEAVAEEPGLIDAAGVDRLCDRLFLSPEGQGADFNLTYVRDRLLYSEDWLARLLDLYTLVRDRRRTVSDAEADPLVDILRLSGVVRVAGGRLRVRNRIYERVFDREWIRRHMPGDAEDELYVSDMNVAYQALAEENFVRAWKLWQKHQKQGHLHGFEWRYLSGVCREDERSTFRHGNWVRSVAFSPDGRTLASGCQDGAVTLWDVGPDRDGALLRERAALTNPGNESGAVFSAAFLDGRTLAAGRQDGTIALWDLRTREQQATLLGHGDRVSALAVSPDGRLLASGSYDETVRLWDLAGGGEPGIVSGQSGAVLSLAFSPDGSILVTGDEDANVTFWDAATGEERTPRLRHRSWVSAVAFAPDGRILATGSWDGTARLWSVSTRRLIASLKKHHGPVLSLAFSFDGRTLATGSQDGTIKLWDLAARRERATLLGHGDRVSALAFSPGGEILASGSYDETVRLWDMAPRRPADVLRERGGTSRRMELSEERSSDRDSGVVRCLAFSPDGKTLATASWGKTVRFWDLSGERDQAPPSPADPERDDRYLAWSVAFSPDGKTLALASGSLIQHNRPGAALLWDVARGGRICDLLGHTAGVSSVAFAPDNRTLATASWDGTVKLWDTSTRRQRDELAGGPGIWCLAYSPDGKLLAAGRDDGILTLWHLGPGREARMESLPAHREVVRCLAFSRSGRTLATGSWDKTIRLWEVAALGDARPPRAILEGHNAVVISVSFSPDGTTLASGSQDNTVKLWSLALGREVATLHGSTPQRGCVAFSPDGALLASGSWDGKVTLWRAASPRPFVL